MLLLPLSVIAMSGVEDVRPVLDHYRQFDDPLSAFKEKHEQLMVRSTFFVQLLAMLVFHDCSRKVHYFAKTLLFSSCQVRIVMNACKAKQPKSFANVFVPQGLLSE